MKKGSTEAAKPSRNISQQQLTIGLDLGDPEGIDRNRIAPTTNRNSSPDILLDSRTPLKVL